jgi:HTH-type transcriptional regulator / antitoxin HigA
MNIHPIKTEADYQMALAEVEQLFDAQPGTPEGDRLDILTTLIEAYEAQVAPIPTPDPIEAIVYYLESRGLSRRDLEPYLGSRARVSEVLNRKRPLTLEMIRRLHANLGIPAEVLIQPYTTTRVAA